MTTYFVKEYASGFDVFGQKVPKIEHPTMKVKDWFFAKNVTNTVPSDKWLYVIGIVKETEKAMQIVTMNATHDGDSAGRVFWCPKSCLEPIGE